MYEYHRTEAERDALVDMLGFLSEYLECEARWQEALPTQEQMEESEPNVTLSSADAQMAAERAFLNARQEVMMTRAGVTNYEMNEFMQELMNNLTRLGEFAEKEVVW